ncbi:MAG: hypothetical protein V3R52_00925 [Candidatus Neomarinimicrobiota bacterium]
MSTFITSLSLILIGFAMIYPLFFIKIYKSNQNNHGTRRYLQLNYLLHVIAGSISVILFWIYRINYPLQLSGIVYLIVIITVVLYYWRSPIPDLNLFSASVVFGIMVFQRSIREIVQLTPLWPGVLVGFLSTGIIAVATVLFVTALWKKFVKNSNASIVPSMLNIIIILISLRALWDLVVLFNVKIDDQNGILMSVYQFLLQNDIIYFNLIIFFGLIIPLIISIIWKKGVDVLSKNQILLLSSGLLIIVWSGEFFFKYFLLQYGIVL